LGLSIRTLAPTAGLSAAQPAFTGRNPLLERGRRSVSRRTYAGPVPPID